MHVLTVVFVLLASCTLLAAAQDSLCIGQDWGIKSKIHQDSCIEALNVPIMLSGSAIIALLIWSAWGQQLAL